MKDKDSLSEFLEALGTVTLTIGIPVLAIVGISKLSESVNRFSKMLTPHDPLTRNTAVGIARQNYGDYNIGQAFAIFDWIKENIRYVPDPSDKDYIAYPRETLETKAGDCDCTAVLTVSMIKAISGLARVVVVYSTNVGHAFAELYTGPKGSINATLKEIQTHYIFARGRPVHWENDKAGGEWLIFDTQLDYPGALPIMAEEGSNTWKWHQGLRLEYHY